MVEFWNQLPGKKNKKSFSPPYTPAVLARKQKSSGQKVFLKNIFIGIKIVAREIILWIIFLRNYFYEFKTWKNFFMKLFFCEIEIVDTKIIFYEIKF